LDFNLGARDGGWWGGKGGNNSVEPWAWLKDVLTRLAARPTGDELHCLLPDRWLAAHPAHRWKIADRRREEREAKTE